MTILHAGEIGRLNTTAVLADSNTFLIYINGVLRQITAAEAKNYFSSNLNITNVTFADSPYQSVTSDEVINVDASGGNVTVLLYALAEGEQIRVKKIDASANTVTIDGNGANIDGASTKIISSQYDSDHLVGGTSEWGLH